MLRVTRAKEGAWKQKNETYLRSSHQRCSMRKGVLRNFTKFTGKHLCQNLFFNKFVGLRPATLLNKRLWHRCFPVNFVKFRRTPFLKNTSGRLLLLWVYNPLSEIQIRLSRNEPPHVTPPHVPVIDLSSRFHLMQKFSKKSSY